MKTVLLNCRLFTGGADLTGHSNKLEMSSEIEAKDATPFRPDTDPDSGWKSVLGGLASTTISASGQWEAGDPGLVDDASWAQLTTRAPYPWMACPVSAAVGELTYFTEAVRSSYKLGEAIGEVAPWEADAMGSTPLLRGVSSHPPGTARTTTGSGTGVELTSVTADQRLWASLHVLSVAGSGTPTITVDVEADTSNAFSAPVVVASFDPVTQAGAQFINEVGPITGPWYRLAWTITGTSPSFLFTGGLAVA